MHVFSRFLYISFIINLHQVAPLWHSVPHAIVVMFSNFYVALLKASSAWLSDCRSVRPSAQPDCSSTTARWPQFAWLAAEKVYFVNGERDGCEQQQQQHQQLLAVLGLHLFWTAWLIEFFIIYIYKNNNCNYIDMYINISPTKALQCVNVSHRYVHYNLHLLLCWRASSSSTVHSRETALNRFVSCNFASELTKAGEKKAKIASEVIFGYVQRRQRQQQMLQIERKAEAVAGTRQSRVELSRSGTGYCYCYLLRRPYAFVRGFSAIFCFLFVFFFLVAFSKRFSAIRGKFFLRFTYVCVSVCSLYFKLSIC